MTVSPIAMMFDRIAPTYDALNHRLSFHWDKVWRRKVAREVARCCPETILDLATGTADLAIAMAKRSPQAHITGADLSEKMLEVGREKVTREGLENQILLTVGDAAELSFPDGAFDVVTVAFGVRNFSHLDQALSEIRRILKPSGSLFILEFSMPTRFPVKQVYGFYLRKILPVIGKHYSKDPDAYRYLSDSVQRFPSPLKFAQQLSAAGFQTACQTPLTFGVVTLYHAKTSSKQ